MMGGGGETVEPDRTQQGVGRVYKNTKIQKYKNTKIQKYTGFKERERESTTQSLYT